MRKAVPHFKNASKNIDIKMIWMGRGSAFSFIRRRKSLDQKYKKIKSDKQKIKYPIISFQLRSFFFYGNVFKVVISICKSYSDAFRLGSLNISGFLV